MCAFNTSHKKMDYERVLAQILEVVKPVIGQGQVATYIPELAKVPADRFGMAVVTVSGEVFRACL